MDPQGQPGDPTQPSNSEIFKSSNACMESTALFGQDVQLFREGCPGKVGAGGGPHLLAGRLEVSVLRGDV